MEAKSQTQVWRRQYLGPLHEWGKKKTVSQNNWTVAIFGGLATHTLHHRSQQEKGHPVHIQLLLRTATEDSTVSFGVPNHYFENPGCDEGEPHLFSKPQKLPSYQWRDKKFRRVIRTLDHVCLAWRGENDGSPRIPSQPARTDSSRNGHGQPGKCLQHRMVPEPLRRAPLGSHSPWLPLAWG